MINFLKTDINITQLELNGEKIEQVQSSKLLGVTIRHDLSWGEHVENIVAKATQRLYFLRLLKRARVSMDKMLEIYCSLVRPTVEYACQVWHGALTGGQSDSIESVQERALEIIMPDASYELACEIAELPTLKERRGQLCKKLFLELQDPSHKLHHLLSSVKEQSRNLRSSKKYTLPKLHTDRAKLSFINWCLFNLQ